MAQDIISDDGIGERAHRRRVQALEKRLSSLTVPVPLRRALSGTLALLREVSPDAATAGLLQLVPSARESLGQEVGEALARAARAAQVAQSTRRGRTGSA